MKKLHEFLDIHFERSVNQILYTNQLTMPDGQVIGYDIPFENDTFQVKTYNWSNEDENDWHFWHKPSGFKICWYKYPLRSPMVNMDISHEEFLDILRDCSNSMHPRITEDFNAWWVK